MIWLLIGCISLHRVGKLAEYDSDSEKIHHATKAIQLAQRETLSDSTAARVLAIQQVGYLRVQDPEVLEGLKVLTQHFHPSIRRTSIWAIGEVGRDMAWDERTQNLTVLLLENLQKSQIELDAHYLLEAILKIYSPHVHSSEEDLLLLRGLHQYLSKTPEPPLVYYILEREVQSLPVLLRLLSEQTQISVDAIYTSNLTILRYLERNHSVLGTPQFKALLQETLQSELDLLTIESQSVQLLSLWILARSAHNQLLLEEIARQLIELAPDLDASVQILIHAALWEMVEFEIVRRYFREHFTQVTDREQLEILGWMNPKVDAIQQLYNIPVSTVQHSTPQNQPIENQPIENQPTDHQPSGHGVHP